MVILLSPSKNDENSRNRIRIHWSEAILLQFWIRNAGMDKYQVPDPDPHQNIMDPHSVADPGCFSWIPDPDDCPSPNPGSKTATKEMGG
jgi:hypothetical protein